MKSVTWKPGLQIPHDPGATEDYVWNWADWLGGETLSSATLTAEDGVTATVQSTDATAVTMRLTGGVAGSRYRVTGHAVSSAGREQNRTVIVVCDAR